MKMWTRAEGNAAGEEDESWGRRGVVGGSVVVKLDIASLLHLTPSTSDVLYVIQCTYRNSSNEHPF